VAVVAGLYAHRAWQAAQAKKLAPPPVPPAVQQRTAEFSFSKEEHGRTLFTVRASRTTEYQEGRKSQLEDVWITIHGRAGRRFDNIHTRQCDYLPATGKIVCAGEVQIDLESAEEARERPGERVIRIATVNVEFESETGEARTESPVIFRFPYGHGHGVGVTYSTRQAVLRVQRDVSLVLLGAGGQQRGGEPVTLEGSGLEYSRATQTLRLLPPVRIEQGQRLLAAGEVALELDSALRARRLTASGNPKLETREQRGEGQLTAREIVASFRNDGALERLLAQGNVRGDWKLPEGQDRLAADALELQLAPGTNEPQQAEARGGVRLESARRGGASQRLETAALRVQFESAAPAGRHVSRAESLAPATVEWTAAGETTRVRGQRLNAEFDARSRIRRLAAREGAEVERRAANRPAQQSASREMTMQFDADGQWTAIEQSGDVRLREGERTARAARAQFTRATEIIQLSGDVTVADSLTRTSAAALSIHQRTGEIAAEGGVRTTYLSAKGSAPANFDRQPAHLSAERLRANRDTGRAVYSGRARLWQGDTVIEADAVELFRDAERLEARGNVTALVPQEAAKDSGTKERTLWRARGAKLTYWGGEGRARLEENASAQSALGQLQAQSLDLYFAAAGSGAPGLARVTARGGVVVRQGERRGTAELGEYVAAEGKFVLSGGKPALYDAARGSVTGRQLTFFLADDKILVEAEEGARTLTKHRVEK
jgi:lipopolysaccharide export system protein LptA/lipopolysaccharide export system protein LptC